jgi:hypothetical protein
MNFTQLEKEICHEIEEILTRYWGRRGVPGDQPEPSAVRPSADAVVTK